MGSIITVDSKKFLREMSDLEKRQFPFILAKSLTNLAKGAQGTVKSEMKRRFIIRRKYVLKGVRIVPARKSDLKNYGFIQSEVYDKDWFMRDQEFGGVRKPRKSKYLAVPAQVRSSKRHKITRRKRPEALLRQENRYFVDESPSGTPVIYKRLKRKIKPMYNLIKKYDISPRFGFRDTVEKFVDQNYDRAFRRTWERVIRDG